MGFKHMALFNVYDTVIKKNWSGDYSAQTLETSAKLIKSQVQEANYLSDSYLTVTKWQFLIDNCLRLDNFLAAAVYDNSS